MDFCWYDASDFLGGWSTNLYEAARGAMLINERLISPKGNGNPPLADQIKNKIKTKNSPSMMQKSETGTAELYRHHL